MKSTLAALLLFAGVCPAALPAESPAQQTDSFADAVLPILQKHCFKCHDAGNKKGGLDLSSYESMMQKHAVTPGAPEKSKLYTSVTGAKPKMPKDATALDQAETDVISAWIKAGAKNPPPTRSGLSSIDEALKTGKDGAKPVVLLFADASPRAKLFLQILSHPALDSSFAEVVYAAVVYEKGGEEAKKYKVTAAPTLLILDPRPETPKELKKLTSGSPGTVRSAIAAAVKTLSK